jgi:hypothetical protein
MKTNVISVRQISLRHLFFFIAIAGLISCTKEKSTETGTPAPGGGGSGGSAVFTLAPTGGNCSDAAVAGTFQAGTNLGADAKLTVTVNVTKAGDWTFSTASVNGFVFAGAGNFTTTGNQSITLFGAGKPTAAGNFDVNLNIGGANCKVTVTVNPQGGGGGGTGDIYYKATIGGVFYTQSVTASNGYEAGSGMGGVTDVVFGGGINYANPPLPAGLTEMGVDKGVMHNYTSATPAQFKAFFAPGDYPYAPASYNNGDGVGISWTDPTGEHWNTRDGPVDQVGSTFKIISTEDAYDALGNYYIKVKMQFNCKLYNENTGAMKPATNGEIVVYFGML